MRFTNDNILSLTTTTANSNGAAIPTSQVFALSLQAVTTGTPTGTLKLQACNDPNQNTAKVPQDQTNWTDITGATVNVTGASTFLIPKLETCYAFMRAVFTSTATGAQTVTTVADVAKSLNSKYFLLNSANASTRYYVWINVNSEGVDPTIVGRTGVEVDIATDDTADTIATAIAAAVDPLALFVSSATGPVVTITNSASGPFTPASDGTAATGFTFAATTGDGTLNVRLAAQAI